MPEERQGGLQRPLQTRMPDGEAQGGGPEGRSGGRPSVIVSFIKWPPCFGAPEAEAG